MKAILVNKLANKRKKLLKKNILISFLFKGGSIGINFLLVPLLIAFLDQEKYGIWLLLTSITTWASFCDFGLGNGLKNKLSEALAEGDHHKAKVYISTTYAYVFVIVSVIMLIYFGIERFIPWTEVVNSSAIGLNDLRLIALVIIGFFFLKFGLNQLFFVIAAKQTTAINDVLTFCINALSLLTVFVLMNTMESSLQALAICFSCIPVAVLLIASIVLYTGPFKSIQPGLRFIEFKQGKALMNLGLQFFIIQVAGIVIFSTDNVIIANLLGPEEVTVYNIAFKYFGIITLGFSVICAPFWPAYTEAFHRGDFEWIKGITKKLVRIWLLFFAATLLILILTPILYKLWVGDEIHVPFFLSLSMAAFVLLSSWASIYTTFVNGAGKIRLQLIFSIIAGISNIPLSIFFVNHLGLGSSGVILATCICLSCGPLLSFVQYKKIITKTAKGIWNK
ncbi:MAG: MATE family efflux transporter [Bacteroidota bacterium]